MKPCIKVKDKEFYHQMLHTGNGDEVRCHFCLLTFPTRDEYVSQYFWEKEMQETRWPEGAEL